MVIHSFVSVSKLKFFVILGHITEMSLPHQNIDLLLALKNTDHRNADPPRRVAKVIGQVTEAVLKCHPYQSGRTMKAPQRSITGVIRAL